MSFKSKSMPNWQKIFIFCIYRLFVDCSMLMLTLFEKKNLNILENGRPMKILSKFAQICLQKMKLFKSGTKT